MNKLGLHIISDEFDAKQLCSPAGASPRVVKLVDPSADFVRRVRSAVGPDCLIIVRWVETTDKDWGHPLSQATRWVTLHLAAMHEMAQVGNIAFEGWNEVPDGLAVEYCDFEMERLSLMHTEGLHAVVGSFSVGTPDLPVWATYRPLLAAMKPGDYLGLHEYWSDQQDIANPWHCARWQLVPALANVPIVVTECGRDVVEGKGKAGWKATCGADEFLADLRAYNSLLEKFPNVRGATVFTGGHVYDQWRDFDVNDLWGKVVMEYTKTSPKLPIPGARVSQRFGENPAYYAQFWLRGHNGVDLAAPDSADYLNFHGTDVCAVADGRAVVVNDPTGYGLYVYVYGEHEDWLYAHLCEVLIANNQQVKAGQVIGRVGYTGNVEPPGVKGTHLHWGKRPKPYSLNNGYRGYVDPLG